MLNGHFITFVDFTLKKYFGLKGTVSQKSNDSTIIDAIFFTLNSRFC